MKQNRKLVNTVFTVIIAAVTWFAVTMQFVISVPEYLGKGRTLAGSIVQLLSYFTILSNTLVAFSLTAVLLLPKTSFGRFFAKIGTATAIAVYIFIVCLVYNLVLRPFWHTAAAFKPNDELLHVFVPALYILYWLLMLPKNGLAWKQLWSWLIFPLLYLVYIIGRGTLTGYYPYFFVDVKTFGFAQVAINAVLLLVIFTLLCALFIAIGRKMIRRNQLH